MVHQEVEKDVKEAAADFVEGLGNMLAGTCATLLQAFDGFYAVEDSPDHNEEDLEKAEPLQEVVTRVLSELPREDSSDDRGNEDEEESVEAEEGDLEKLLRECESWKTIYPLEQEG